MVPPPAYREIPPGRELAPSIECFWTSAAPAPAAPTRHRVVPDGCMDLIFDFTAATGIRASVVGTMTTAKVVELRGRADLLGVRFRAGALAGALGSRADELRDARVDLGHFWGPAASRLWHRLGECAAPGRLGLLVPILSRRLRGAPCDPATAHCVARIEGTEGRLRIGELQASTGFSSRQLERKFAQQVGVPPKALARIARFKAALSALERPARPGWADVAAAAGFADQAHLAREFRTLSGVTPTAYAAELAAGSGDVGFVQDPAPDSC